MSVDVSDGGSLPPPRQLASSADLDGRPPGTESAGSSVIVVAGPTASGKESLALELARRLSGEIISMDSMKVYREMEIATAKPGAALRREVRHHLVDIVDLDAEFSAAEWLVRAERAVDDVRARGRQAILSGGTPLYLKTFLAGLSEGPSADWELRRSLIEDGRRQGLDRLHERLRGLDPAAAARIAPGDERRIVRALEVCQKTGRPASDGRLWDAPQRSVRSYVVRVVGIDWPRAELYARIDRRVERMVEDGLFEEAERLALRQPPVGRTARQSIGFKEVIDGLAAGRSRQEITARIQQGTRRFAKRQLTWLRKFEIEWTPAGAGADPVRWADELGACPRNAP